MITLKSPQELEKMQKSADLVSEVLNMVIDAIEPGITTIELDWMAEKAIRDAGAVPMFKGYRGFPYTLCISINEQVVHGFPSNRTLKEGDVLSVDVGAKLHGFVGDSARSITVGKVSKDVDLMIRRAYYALEQGCKAAVAGNRVGDISHAVQSVANRFGYGIVRDFVGHGLGREMHEDPQIPNYGTPGTGTRLKTGLVLCVEPMFNLGTHEVEVMADRWTVVTKDRKTSVHVENTVAILPDGPKILTSAKGVVLPSEEEMKSLPASVN